MTTQTLKTNWLDYISELLRMKWSLKYGSPEYMRVNEIVNELNSIVDKMVSSEIEIGDTVTNGKESFIANKIEGDRVYDTENTFYHKNELRIKAKHENVPA